MEKNYKGRDIMITTSQIRIIHTLKSQLGLDDEVYRDILHSFDASSCKQLSEAEARIVIQNLQEKLEIYNKKFKKKFEELEGRDKSMATPKQLRKIEAIWSEIYDKSKDRTERAKALRGYLKKHFKISDLRFLTKARARDVIPIFEKIRFNKLLKAI